ncbi:MAG: FCD domain-containing protein [Rhodospirillales bacterium]|nr:FCD domain-containing protein [Rhodospirillales bacterium]
MLRTKRERSRPVGFDGDRGSAIDLVALELLRHNDGPVGNHKLVTALRQAGIGVAEATAGRALRELVTRGLARTLGKRGRVLTPSGEKMLDDLKRGISRRQRSARLVDVASIENAESLRDMLLVRRAIEPEAARLAASRATEEDIRQLESFARAHCSAPTEGGNRVEPAVCFHCQLIRSSHHKFLIEIGLLAIEQNDTPLLDKISHNPGVARRSKRETDKEAKALAQDHEAIADAIRRRDPGTAERRMRAHIDRLLTGTVAYIDRINDQS